MCHGIHHVIDQQQQNVRVKIDELGDDRNENEE